MRIMHKADTTFDPDDQEHRNFRAAVAALVAKLDLRDHLELDRIDVTEVKRSA